MVAPNSCNFVNNWKLTVRIFFNYSQRKVRYYEAICKNNELGPIKPKLDIIKVKIKKNTPSSAIIVFN
jgi:hypothetical protein